MTHAAALIAAPAANFRGKAARRLRGHMSVARGKQSEAAVSRAALRTRKRSAAERQVMPRVSKPG